MDVEEKTEAKKEKPAPEKKAVRKKKKLISVDINVTAAVTIHNKQAIFLHDGRREVLDLADRKLNVTISDA